MIWIIGVGPMTEEYSKVLNDLEQCFTVIGRSLHGVSTFETNTGIKARAGGLEQFLETKPEKPSAVIVAVGVEQLYPTTLLLLNYGVKSILVEKPAGINKNEIDHLSALTIEKSANVYVAYNRRFFSSVAKAQSLIEQDGGPISFNFEITEWGHVISKLKKEPLVKQHWFLANTTHVVDLAFFLGGRPKELTAITSGALSWHASASIFAGVGTTDTNAVFSYHGNWESAGRWSLEVLTRKRKLVLSPMEALKEQLVGTIAQTSVQIDDALDKQYKPGLYRQVVAFLGDKKYLCTLASHKESSEYYTKMANY